MLIEEEQLENALLENPKSATTKDLMTSISRKLMEDDNLLLNNLRLMSSEKALQRRLERGKEKLLGKQGKVIEVRQKLPKYFNVGHLDKSDR